MSDSGKGIPFEFITKTYLTIEDLTLKGTELHRKVSVIPDQVVPTKSRRKVKSVLSPTSKLGTTTQMPKLVFLGAMILKNELLGCIGRATDKHGINRAFRKEYPKDSNKTNNRYFNKFSEFRNKYNKGELYKNQTLPSLYCFYWNENGYIRHSTIRTQHLSFQFCKRMLITDKFCDPRFFTIQERKAYAKEENWFVPTQIDIDLMEAEIQKPLYDSIVFPPGWGKEYNPL